MISQFLLVFGCFVFEESMKTQISQLQQRLHTENGKLNTELQTKHSLDKCITEAERSYSQVRILVLGVVNLPLLDRHNFFFFSFGAC